MRSPFGEHADLSAAERQVRLSTNATLEQNLRFPDTQTLRSAYRDAYFLQLSKIVPEATALGISAPGGAQGRSGAGAAKKARKQIKNPATSAGRIRPSLWASFPRALGRMCSKLDFQLPGVRNQPHLWMSRQARSVSRLPRESGLHQLQSSISKSKIPSSCIQDFFIALSQCPCEFHRRLCKSRRANPGLHDFDCAGAVLLVIGCWFSSAGSYVPGVTSWDLRTNSPFSQT